MIKGTKLYIGENEYTLLYNAEAFFELNEKYENIYESIAEGKGKASFDAAIDALAVMAQQGELARRALGYDRADMLTVETLRSVCSIKDVIVLRKKALEALDAGLEMLEKNKEESGPIDVTLAEIEKKTIIR